MAFDVYFDQISILFDQHALLHKLAKTGKSFTIKPLIHKGIQIFNEKP